MDLFCFQMTLRSLDPKSDTGANAMAKLSELIPVLSRQFDARDFPERTVAVFARHLRLARLLNTGGRGLGGAEMTPTDCTNMILAMASGLPAQDAAEAVATYRDLKQSYVDFMRDKGAPRVAWIDELKGAKLGALIDRIIASATSDEFDELGRIAMDASTHRNWYVLINLRSPRPGAEIIIGCGGPYFSGDLRKHNKVIAAFHFAEPPKTIATEDDFDFEDAVAREKFMAAQRGWNADRVRTESIGRSAIKAIGSLLAEKSK